MKKRVRKFPRPVSARCVDLGNIELDFGLDLDDVLALLGV